MCKWLSVCYVPSSVDLFVLLHELNFNCPHCTGSRLRLPFPMINILYFYISTFRSMCTVSSMAFSYDFSISYFPGMLLSYFLNNFEMVPVFPIIAGIIFVFTLHLSFISLYFRIFSASFLITFLSPEVATSFNTHVPLPLPRIMMSRLLLRMALSVCTFRFHNVC